jgi:hypothetical protein
LAAIGVVDRERRAQRLGDLSVRLARLAVGRDAEEHERHRDHRDDHDDHEEQQQSAAEAHFSPLMDPTGIVVPLSSDV